MSIRTVLRAVFNSLLGHYQTLWSKVQKSLTPLSHYIQFSCILLLADFQSHPLAERWTLSPPSTAHQQILPIPTLVGVEFKSEHTLPPPQKSFLKV